MFGITPSITSMSGTSLNIRSTKATIAVDRVTSTDRVTDPGQSSIFVDFWGRLRHNKAVVGGGLLFEVITSLNGRVRSH